ncbi:MAG: type II secretion system F family protein [Candidatus Binatus sp.]|jgi:tight adherence protein B|uniref:type II secretion system F family protein n=1 Tax=Candidatus Binatus sp. TaxID=2811406 RepID=UPI003C86EFA2
MNLGDLLIPAAAAGFVLIACAMLFMRPNRPRVTRTVMRRMSRPNVALADDITKTDRQRLTGREFLSWFYRLNLLQKLEENLWQAGIYARIVDVLLVIMVMFTAGLIAGEAIWGLELLSIAIGAAMASLPIIYIRLRRQRRLKAFAKQLPYALDLIKSSLEAGHTLLRGLQVVVAEFADPISTEFRSAIEQSRLGLPLARSLEEMLKRVPQDDLRLLVVAVRVQAEVGSSLAVIIGRLSEIVRTRQRLQQQIKALTAQSKMSGILVGFLPIVMLGAFSIIQPSYTDTLFYDPSGQKILEVACVLDALAFLSIRKLLKVKY